MSKVILKLSHENKTLYITHIDMNSKYVLGTYNKDLTKLKKLELDTLKLSNKDNDFITKYQINTQF